MSATLDFVSLYLYDHGPATLTAISAATGIPLPTLRTHLHLNCPDRYLARLTIEHGTPVRRWELAPTLHPKEGNDE